MTSRDADASGSQSVADSVISGHSIMIGRADGNVNINLGTRSYGIYQFLSPSPLESAYPRSKRTPSYLLDPIRAIVPFVDRREHAAVLDWCNDGEVTHSIMMLIGAGGKGKTRLARQVAVTLEAAKWKVVEISRTPHGGLRTVPPRAPTVDSGSLLAIVDYADRWPLGEVVEAVSDLLAAYAQWPRIRVLLIARSAHMWRDLKAMLDPLALDIIAEPLELGEFAFERDLDSLFQMAVVAFAQALNVVSLPIGELPRSELGNSPLVMHMAALAKVLGYQPTEDNADQEVSTFLLRHERRYWQSRNDFDREAFERMTFVATMFGPVGSDDAIGALTALGIGEEATCRRLLQAHRALYPPPGRPIDADDIYLMPLQPDRFGEDFLVECLHDSEQSRRDLDGLLSLNESVKARYPLRGLLDKLAACADRHVWVSDVIWRAIRRRPSIVRHAGPQMIDRIAEHADIPTARIAFTGSSDWCDDSTYAAIRLGSRLVADQASLTYLEQLRELLELAHLLVMHRDWDAARPLIFRAAKLLDKLPQDDPNLDRFRAEVSSLLGFPEIGATNTTEHAQLAISFLRKAAKEKPDRYAMPLAGALANHSTFVLENEGAEVALTISGEALKITTDYLERASNPTIDDMIARSVVAQNHGCNLTQAGRPKEALEPLREAVSTWNKLVEINWVHSVRRLSSALNALAEAFDKLGALDGTVECAAWNVELWRHAAQTEPDAIKELVPHLSRLGAKQLKNRQPEAALEAIEEALTLMAVVDAQNSVVDAGVEVILRSNRSIAYLMSKQYDVAVDVAYEAVEFADRVIRIDGQAPSTLMPMCLLTLGNALRAAERLDEAIAAYGACVRIAELSGELTGSDGNAVGILELASKALVEMSRRDKI